MPEIWTKELPVPDAKGEDYYWLRFGQSTRIERVGSAINSLVRAEIIRTDCWAGPKIPSPEMLAAMTEYIAANEAKLKHDQDRDGWEYEGGYGYPTDEWTEKARYLEDAFLFARAVLAEHIKQ